MQKDYGTGPGLREHPSSDDRSLPPSLVPSSAAGGPQVLYARQLLEQAGLRRIIHVIGPYSDWDRLHLAATIPG